jgi:hypothetical protein
MLHATFCPFVVVAGSGLTRQAKIAIKIAGSLMSPKSNCFAVALLLGPSCAFACKCAPSPLPKDGTAPVSSAVCNHLPDSNVRGKAIFVGTVVDVYPRSVGHMAELWERGSGRKLSEEHPPNLTELKELILLMWRESLTSSEVTRILSADSEDALDNVLDEAFGWGFARRGRLKVSERFVGAPDDAFELYTGFGGGDCGVGFNLGEQYLVFATQDETPRRWRTTICSGTQSVLYAEEEVRTLRAWKTGESLPPRIYGSVWDSTHLGDAGDTGEIALPRVEVRLSGDNSDRVTFTDVHGRFKFDDLVPGRYRIMVQLPGWQLASWSPGRGEIDLTKASCAELRLDVEEATQRHSPR